MRYILTALAAIFFTASYGQNFTYPAINAKGENIKDFVPAGWTILDSAVADMNKDGIKDAAIVIQHIDSVTIVNSLEDTVHAQPRILLLLFKTTTGNGYVLKEQSNTFILKHDNPSMEDPYGDIKINNGILEIKFQVFYNMGSWYNTNAVYKFRFGGEEFVLIGADYHSLHRASNDFEKYSYNFLLKKRALTKGNNTTGAKKMHMKTLSLPELKTLRTFKEPFTWEVEKDVYL